MRRYINQRRMQNKLPPMLALGRVKIRAVIQNPVRLPVRIMIALLSSSNLKIETTSSFILLCGRLFVGRSCWEVGNWCEVVCVGGVTKPTVR